MITSWWKDPGATVVTRDRMGKKREGGTDTETGPIEKPPAGAAVTIRATNTKTSNPNSTLKLLTDKTDEDFNNNVPYEALLPSKSKQFLIHKVFLLIFPLGLYMEKLKSNPKLK